MLLKLPPISPHVQNATVSLNQKPLQDTVTNVVVSSMQESVSKTTNVMFTANFRALQADTTPTATGPFKQNSHSEHNCK